jgi:hypothetical protein
MTESLIDKLKSLKIINPLINNFETIKDEYNIIDNKNEMEFMQQTLKKILILSEIDTIEKIKLACIEYLGNDLHPLNAIPRVIPNASVIKDVTEDVPVTKNPLKPSVIPSPSLSASSSRSETPSIFSSRSETPSIFSSRNVTPNSSRNVTPNSSRNVTPILNPRRRLPPLSLENAARRNAISHSLKNRPSNNKSAKNPMVSKSLFPPSSSSEASSRESSTVSSRPAPSIMFSTGPKSVVPQIFEFTIPSTGKILTIQLNTTKEGISSTESINKRIFIMVDNKIKIDTTKDRAEKYYNAIINNKEYIKEYDKDGYIILKPRTL